MSNIPKARRILQDALDSETPHEHIREALAHMQRNVGFITKPRPSGVTLRIKKKFREMRNQGMALHDIGIRFGVSQGIVGNALKTLEDVD